MNYKNILILITLFIFITPAYSNEIDCTEFKKFSAKYIECNAKKLKEKTNEKVKASKEKLKDSGIKDKFNKLKGSKTLSDLIKN